MKVTTSTVAAVEIQADALVVLVTDGELTGTAAEIDVRMNGQLRQLIEAGEISAKIGKTYVLNLVQSVASKTLLLVGAGPVDALQAGEALRIGGSAAKRLADRARGQIAFALDNLDANLVSSAVCGAINGGIGQDLMRTDKNLHTADELIFLTAHTEGVARGEKLGRAVALVRELVNLPPNLLNPTSFTQRALAECAARNIEIEVWDEMRLRKERCGSLLGVAAGSQNPPRLLIMRYRADEAASPVALVGKGVTFDSGGLSIKPSDSMLTMKCDMAGAATVLGTMCAAADLGVQQPIVGLVGLVENMISGNAFRLGDVLTARSGTTIEVHNTDAEGRLVLADVLNVALEYEPACIIDLATLTGACVVALGVDIAGLMTNDVQLQTDYQSAAERAGELVWPLPMHKFFNDQILSQVADIKNVGDGRWGGATTAAKFLERFVADTPWLHIDIAGPAFADKPKTHHDAGGTGCMLRTLVEFLSSR